MFSFFLYFSFTSYFLVSCFTCRCEWSFTDFLFFFLFGWKRADFPLKGRKKYSNAKRNKILWVLIYFFLWPTFNKENILSTSRFPCLVKWEKDNLILLFETPYTCSFSWLYYFVVLCCCCFLLISALHFKSYQFRLSVKVDRGQDQLMCTRTIWDNLRQYAYIYFFHCRINLWMRDSFSAIYK